MEPRVAASVLATALIRKAEGEGGFGAVLAKGDPTALIRGFSSGCCSPMDAMPGRRAEANVLKIQRKFRSSSHAEGASTRIHG
jgi:hypothetical protein